MDADLAVKLGVILAVLAAWWVLLDWDTSRERALRIVRSRRPDEPRPSGPPIERIAADARRIRAEIQHAPPGIPVARMRGWLEAYDDVLVAACRALDLEQRLGALPEGPERDLERERVERVLMSAGVLLRPSA
jgi:hypothetical protein